MGNKKNSLDEKPVISIITPSFNQGEYVGDTVRSVLNQDYPNIQYMVVDGGSTDQTLEVLDKYRDKLELIVEPDDGQVDALLKGFARAHGDIVTWLNADDVYIFRDTLSKVVSLFHTTPHISVISGSSALIDSGNKLLQVYRAPPRFSHKQLMIYDYIRQPATFFRSCVLRGNDLDRTLTCAFDYDLWLRLAKDFKFMMVRDILAGIRRHSEMKTIRLSKIMREESEAVRARYKHIINISLLDKMNGVALRAVNKVAGLSLVAGIYKDTKHLERSEKRLAVPITTDNFARTCLRQLLNHRGMLF